MQSMQCTEPHIINFHPSNKVTHVKLCFLRIPPHCSIGTYVFELGDILAYHIGLLFGLLIPAGKDIILVSRVG